MLISGAAREYQPYGQLAVDYAIQKWDENIALVFASDLNPRLILCLNFVSVTSQSGGEIDTTAAGSKIATYLRNRSGECR